MLNLSLCVTDMCIFQHPSAGGSTEIYPLEGDLRCVNVRPEKLIDQTLIYFGSNIRTRRQSAKVLTGYTHHLPVIIEPTLEWMYYPVHQSKAHFQLFLNYKSIYHFEGNKHQTTIYFINGSLIEVPQNVSFVQKQHQKALYLADVQAKLIKRQLHMSHRLKAY
ncbi:competence protein ComK [Macrococcus equi]|uniref:competence protein ComK n=1 Tax=Macrococcus equi TaxID=3395462 RepID=UPI0039BEA3A8